MNWLTKLPPWECQYSAKGHTDAEDCVAESLCHVVYMLTGRRYSPRALAYMSNTSPTGNYTNIVLSVANGTGLVPYDLWPIPDEFTWESYYADIPADVRARTERLDLRQVPIDLNVSPGWTEIGWGVGTASFESHMVAQVSDTQYFDSESGEPVKPIDYEGAQVIWRTSLVVPPVGLLMAQLLTGAGTYDSGKLSVDQWSWYWAQILGGPVDGTLLDRAFPALTGTDRLSLTAAEFAAAVTNG